MTFNIICPCIEESRQKERAENIHRGRQLIRKRMRDCSGMALRSSEATFKGFAPVSGQENALNECVNFCKNFNADKTGKGLLLYGMPGTGKTYLAAACANYIINKYNASDEPAEQTGRAGHCEIDFESYIYFTSVIELLNRIRRGFNAGDCFDIIDRAKECRLLVLDDFGAENAKDWGSERLFEIVDARYNNYKPLIITTNLTPAQLVQRLDKRLWDRLRAMCIAVEMQCQSQR